jgi:hypothetical protein
MRIYQDIVLFLQETACRAVLKKPFTPTHPEECFLNPPCGCANPGKDIQCEDCPYLEGCLSYFKTSKASRSDIKVGITAYKRS